MRKAGRAPTQLVELQVERLDRLFDAFDPFPLPTRDLSSGAEDFIVGWARELPANAPIRLRLHLPATQDAQADVGPAIARHFAARAERARGDLRELFARGRASLAIGLGMLALCIGVRQVLLALLPAGPVAAAAAESVLIVGWVANWRPLEIFLYDWWPVTRRRRLYLRLAAAPVEIVVANGVSASMTPARVDHDQSGQAPGG